MPRVLIVVALAVLLPGAEVACDGDGSGGPSAVTVTVLAAASLTDAFGEMADSFTESVPDVSVELVFGSSSELAVQIEQGAPADVFAPADQESMRSLVVTALTGERRIFARNSLSIVVAPGNPLEIEGLSDLADDDLVVALGAEEVPVGRYARQALAAANVTVHPDTLETDVKAIVTRVALGEADVGIVYTTDVIAAGEDVDGVSIPLEQNVVARYPIGVVGDAPPEALAFVDFVLSEAGAAILEAHGFVAP